MPQTQLTAQEKMFVVRTHQYFLSDRLHRRDPERLKMRQHVGQCLGFGEATVARVIAHWNRHSDLTFTAGSVPRTGRPVQATGETCEGIRKRIRERTSLSLRSVRRLLRRMKMRYVIEEKKHISS